MNNLGAYIAATAAAAVGLRDDALVIAVAIAGAESSWQFDAVGDKDNPEKGCGSYGLWQINSCPGRDAGSPTRFGDDPRNLFDPLVNARAMFAISSGGTNWQPWTVYRTGKYRDKIGEARKAVEAIDGKKVEQWAQLERLSDRPDKGSKFSFRIATPFGDITSESGPTKLIGAAGDTALGVIDAVTDPLQAVARFFGLLLKPETWLRALALIVGVAVLVLGVQFIVKDQGIGVMP